MQTSTTQLSSERATRAPSRTLLAALTALTVLLANPAQAADDFTLKDQFGNAMKRSEVFSNTPVVVIAGASRKTPDAMRDWERTLRNRMPKHVRLVGLSDLDGVPFFVPRGSIKKMLVEKLPRMRVLLDWDGDVYAGLGFPKGSTIAVGVYSSAGKRIALIESNATDAQVEKVIAVLAEP